MSTITDVLAWADELDHVEQALHRLELMITDDNIPEEDQKGRCTHVKFGTDFTAHHTVDDFKLKQHLVRQSIEYYRGVKKLLKDRIAIVEEAIKDV